MKTEKVKLTQIQVNASNPRTITNENFDKLVNSILVLPKMLELRPIVVDDIFTALGGNMRYRALIAIAQMKPSELVERLTAQRDYQKKTQAEQERLISYWRLWQGEPTAQVIKASELTADEQREFIIKDNVGFGEWDMDALANEWDSAALADWGVNVWQDNSGNGGSGSGGGSGMSSDGNKERSGSLLDRFVVPPFSILDTRQGYWQERKKLWKERIGDMGETRNQTLFQSPEILYKDLYSRTMKHRKELGISFTEYIEKYVPADVLENEKKKVTGRGVSILDPVMAELVCRWFGLDGCKSFDCFAGDSVFGYVSSYLGNEFVGIELRQEQCELNNERVGGMNARYINDDGQNVALHIEPESQDLLFSCPPYFDLEHYSDLPNDASNQKDYEAFLQILRKAFTDAVGCLRENRFAVIVVGDVRDKRTGFYYGFADDVKAIFRDAGMRLLNELIIVENPASSPLRVGCYMEGRKVAKTHQNVLVFYKGNANDIKKHFKKIEYASEDLESFGVDTGNEPSDAQGEV